MPLNYPVLDSLISQFEGFGKSGVPATVNNNPGNIIGGNFATQNGAVSTDSRGFAVFPDVQTGTQAQDNLIQHYAGQGLSIQDLINKWSPGTAPGNTPAGTQSYVDYVSGQLGVPASTPLTAAEVAGQKKTADTSSSGSTTPGTSDTGAPTNPTLNDYAFRLVNGRWPGQTGAQQAANPDSVGTLSFGRVGAFVLGMILIAGGIYLFKPVQEALGPVRAGALL